MTISSYWWASGIRFVRFIRRPDVVSSLVVFAAILSATKFSRYVLTMFETSPAVIFPPAGIALAAMILGGYRMTIPIALAFFISASTNLLQSPLAFVFAVTASQTVTPLIGTYVLRRFGDVNIFERVRNVLIFVGVAFLVYTVTPTVTTMLQIIFGTLSDPIYISWTRSWASHVLSILVITPFLISWLPWKRGVINSRNIVEVVVVFVALLLSLYLLFWTQAVQAYAFPLLCLLLAILFVVSFRMDRRMISLSIFLMAVLSMAGVMLVERVPIVPLGQRLFSIELFVMLIAPVFFLFAALAYERRVATKLAKDHVKQLEEAMQKLSFQDRSKNEFIAILAHELRNPLAPLVSTLELLKIQKQPPETMKLIKSAEAQTRFMRRLLDDLLDVARVSRKQFKLHKESVNLKTLISRCMDSVQGELRTHEHTFEVSLPREDVLLDVDSVRFEQIISNLLNNAAKYTPPKGHIELTASIQKGMLDVRVSDNGIGISSTELPRVFEPFRQVKPNARVGTGLGIGLSLTKRLVEMHKGTIQALSRGEGKGSTFIVRLPVLSNEQLPIPKNAHVKNKPSTSKYPLKILVVDDNEAAAEGLGALLEIRGHTVSLAYDGQSALKAVSRFSPEVVILDIGLPDIDGYEVVKRLRNEKFLSTVIALSGYGQEEDKLKARNAGFDHHITKPVGIEEIESVLSRIPEAGSVSWPRFPLGAPRSS